MYNRIDVIHRPRCSKLLLTLLRMKELPVQGLLSAMQISFSESETLESAISAPHRRLEKEQWIQSSAISKQQIENKTLGLVDAEVASAELPHSSTAHIICADFLHRTVYDFFLLEGLQEEMKAEVPRNFDPSTTLLACYLVEIKAFPRQRLVALQHDRVISDAMNCLRLVRFLELEQKLSYPDVMKCIDESMNHYWVSIRGQTKFGTWAQAIVTEMYRVRWSHISPYLVSKTDYFSFLGVLSGCAISVASRAKPGSNVTNNERSQMLSMLILRYFNDFLREDGNYQSHFGIGNDRSNFVTAIGLLLEYGADPGALGILSPIHTTSQTGFSSVSSTDERRTQKTKLPYSTPWEYFLDHVSRSIQVDSHQDIWKYKSRRSEVSLLEAINLLKIYQHFLKFNVNITQEVETTMEQLKHLFDQSLSTYSHDENRDHVSQFNTEYCKTRDMVNKKRMRFMPGPQIRAWWDLRRLVSQDTIELSTSNIIIGILILVITYLSSVS